MKIYFVCVSEHCASFEREKKGIFAQFSDYFENKIDHISNTKIGKIVFHSFQNIAQLFGTNTQYVYFWGVFMSLIV